MTINGKMQQQQQQFIVDLINGSFMDWIGIEIGG
jgi:hypothetical protein